MKHHPDVNDTLRERGIEAVRERHDRAHRDSRKTEKTPPPPQVLPPPSDPMAVARKFIEHWCLHNGAAGELRLRCWHGGWWAWRTTHWVEIEVREVRALLYAFTEHALYETVKGPAPWLPTRRKIGDLA